MPRIKIHRSEGQPALITIGHDRLVFETDLPDGTVATRAFRVSPVTGNLLAESLPEEDPHEAGALWGDAEGNMKISRG